MKKRLLAIVVLVAMMIGVIGVMPAMAEDKVKIVFSQIQANASDESIERFEKYFMQPLREAFPDYEFEFAPFGDWQTLQVQIAGGAGPDFFQLNGPSHVAEYAKAGKVVSLDKYAEQYGWADIFYPWAYDTCKKDGELFGLPYSFEGTCVYYNTAVLKENGWEVPTTRAEFEALCDAALEKGMVPIAFGNSNVQSIVNWIYTPIVNAYVGTENMKKVLRGEMKWTDPIFVEAFQTMVDWWQKGYIGDKKSQGITIGDAEAMFTTGKSPIHMAGTWTAGGVAFDDFDWVSTSLPELNEGMGVVTPLGVGGAYCINANSKYQDECAEILNYLFTHVELNMKAVEEANFAAYPVKDFDADKLTNLSDNVRAQYDMLSEAQAAGNIGYCSWTFFPGTVESYMAENTDALFLNMLSVEDFLADVEEIMEKALAEGFEATI